MAGLQGKYARNHARRNRNTNYYIDDTLFGGKTRQRTGRRSNSAPAHKNAVTVTKNELMRLQGNSVILSPADEAELKATRQAEKDHRMRKGIARKERMLRMEEDKRRKAPVLSDYEVNARMQQNKVLAAARKMMDEEMDDVKHMNQMMAYAQCVTIRDAQIKEKAHMQQQLAEANRRQDLAMEVERVRQLKMTEERDHQRAEEQRIGAQVIIQQIQEREASRLQEQEKQEQEAAAMVQKQKKLEAQEEAARLEKVAAGKALMAEVRKENDRQAQAKLAQRQREIEEEKKIAEYIREKEAREARAEAEKEQLRAQKEHELAIMRAQREKASNRQAQIDGLRAKRYQEAKDRAWRQAQLEQAQKAQVIKKQVAIARDQQKREKSQLMAQQAMLERAEYERTLRWQQVQQEQEEAEKQRQKDLRYSNRRVLYQQIQTHEQEKREAREAFLAQGKEIQMQQELDARKLQRIKAMKLQQLRSSGVPDKYTAELAKKKSLAVSIH